jgi:hypothetical protein
MGMCTASMDIIIRLLQNYCGACLLRCAVLGILMYIEYIPVPARRAPRIRASSLRFNNLKTFCQEPR